VAPRRSHNPTSKTRASLLDATEQIMLEEGYAGVTSRSVAARAGVHAGLIHYYFPSVDDLFVATVRRRSEQNLERLARALESDHPLRVVWAYANDKTGAALMVEFAALANHRKAVRAELAELGERVRKLQLEAVAAKWADYGLDPDEFPPLVIVSLMTSIPRMIVMEENADMEMGHPETVAWVERFLDQVEPQTSSGRAAND
jgi:TetR/AcrR family transcriptional regulator, transcriptional repressor for nem operon